MPEFAASEADSRAVLRAIGRSRADGSLVAACS
jgi:hypothetical protein